MGRLKLKIVWRPSRKPFWNAHLPLAQFNVFVSAGRVFKLQHCLTTVSLCKESFLNKAKTGLQPALLVGSRVSPAEPNGGSLHGQVQQPPTENRRRPGVVPAPWEVSENPADLTGGRFPGSVLCPGTRSVEASPGTFVFTCPLHLHLASAVPFPWSATDKPDPTRQPRVWCHISEAWPIAGLMVSPSVHALGFPKTHRLLPPPRVQVEPHRTLWGCAGTGQDEDLLTEPLKPEVAEEDSS